jgi:16S rRNA processing protein RimM
MDNRLIPIGKIEGIHGLKGEVKARMLSDFPERLASVTSIYVIKNGSKKRRAISQYRSHKKGVLIAFEGIETANDAKQLEGSVLCIGEHEMLSPPADTYYIHELIGFDVYDEGQNRLGELKEVWQLPANDVFVVQDASTEMLFPATKDAVKCISREKKQIVVTRKLGVI